MAAWRRTEYPRDKGECYRLLGGQLSALMEGERDALANLANAAALIYQALPDLNPGGPGRARLPRPYRLRRGFPQ